jgi:hypothetical protein
MPSLKSLFGRTKTEEPAETVSTECPHVVLHSRWDDPKDMGNDEAASAFYCEACGTTFSADEGRQLRATESERLHRDLGTNEH